MRQRLLWTSGCLLLVLACALTFTFAIGEARQRRRSPHEAASGTVDGAELSITYGRPSMRGRTIMGGLVPYGVVWCPGADQATTLSTNKRIRIGNLTLAAGQYTLWMLPAAGAWAMIVNKETGQFHTQYDARQDLGRVDLLKRALAAPVEQLTFTIEQGEPAGGVIRMTWETTDVSAPFTVVQ
jgi:hypothetical protein